MGGGNGERALASQAQAPAHAASGMAVAWDGCNKGHGALEAWGLTKKTHCTHDMTAGGFSGRQRA